MITRAGLICFLSLFCLNADTLIAQKVQEPRLMESESQFADLPFGITSFGAVRLGDAIYVYGGHTGGAHSYSKEEQSNKLLKLDLTGADAKWEVIATGERRLQGVALVAYENQLILVGGFEAMNAEGEDQDLHSRAFVTSYDVSSKKWTELPALPKGRSSHDAVVLDGVLYVVGGWTMDTPKETEWHTTAHAMDLKDQDPQWEEIPAPEFKRRALALAPHDGKLFVIGGMTPNGTTREVNCFDPAKGKWIAGPELVGKDGMAGFGNAAWSVDGKLVVANYYGDVQVLSEVGDAWTVAGQTKDARFFHRLIPISKTALLSVGGASMESGKFLTPEVIELQ